MKPGLIVIICLFMLSSCSQSKENKHLPSNRIALLNSNKINLFDKLTIDKHIVLEPSKESMFAGIDKLMVQGNKVFIMDQLVSKAIFMFDESGRFINKWTEGKGPDQFQSVDDFFVCENGDTLTVLSRWEKKLLSYNTIDGKKVNEKGIPEGAMKFVINNGNVIYEINPKNGYHLTFENKVGELETQISIPVYDSDTIPVMNGFQNNGKITRLFSLDTVIHEILENTAKPLYSLNFDDRNTILKKGSVTMPGKGNVTSLRHWLLKDYVIIQFVLENKSHFVLHDISSGISYSSTIGGEVSGNETMSGLFLWVVGSTSNQLIVAINPYDLLHIKPSLGLIDENTLSKNAKDNLNKLLEISSKVEYADNPVLLFLNIN